MPALFKMSDNKKNEDIPAVVFAESQTAAPPRKTKKYVIIAVTVVLAVGIILAAILVGMYIFTQAQKDIIQYTMQLGANNKQDVTSNPNENVVQFHVSTPSQDAWIINDFNKDLQLVKVVSDGQTNCYLSALNRTNAMEPSMITGPDTEDPTEAVSLMYQTSDTPIADTSFLSKTASAACKGISVYWLYPYCSNGNENQDTTDGPNLDNRRKKRDATNDTIDDKSLLYCQNYESYQSPDDDEYYDLPCYTGCCRKVCACHVSYTSYKDHGYIYCHWVLKNCPPTVVDNPVIYDRSCVGPTGVSCPYADHTCGCPN
jgi:hypothetical protein